MGLSIERILPDPDAEEIVVVRDPDIGLHAIIVIDSTRRGPAFGGIRRWSYPCEGAALADARALAQAMSQKCALAGLPAGGAKTVLVDTARGGAAASDRLAWYRALGQVVESLGGRYVCGPDIGTGAAELDIVRARTRWVNPEGNDAAAATAKGVLAGMTAVFDLLDLHGSPRVAIAGLGAVGLEVARGLLARGAMVMGADIRPEACRAAQAIGVTIVAPEVISRQPCDVFSPCAMGEVFDEACVQALACRAICGSANNQIVDVGAARLLVAREIVHAPDVLVSAGAVIEGVLTMRAGTASSVRLQVERAIERLRGVTREVLEQALREKRPPVEVANERARAIISA